MPSMTAGSVMMTAILRGFYNFICTSAAAGITSYLSMMAVLPDSTSNDDILQIAVLTGALAGLAALGFRGGAEGLFDRNRAVNNDVRASDVPSEAPGVTVIEPAKP
jgi:hypothetical protein